MKKVIVFLIVLLLLSVVGITSFSLKDTESQTVDAVSDVKELKQENFNVLLYSKANGWVHKEAIPAAKKLFESLAEENNWTLMISHDSAVYNAEQLAFYDVVVWNNVTGNTLNTEQRTAFKNYLENGGGFVGFHGSGDNSRQWEWYYEKIIRAEFSHHPMEPQFQVGTLNRECPDHFPTCSKLAAQWEQEEEWYVFHESPRKKGAHILYTLDETDLVMSGVVKEGSLED